MKKKAIYLLAIVLVLCASALLSGCKLSNAEEEEALADERSEQVMTAIINKDKEGLKSAFSEYVLTEVEDLDEQIDELFEYFDGEIRSWTREYGISSHTHITYGVEQERDITFDIVISTGQRHYRIICKEWIVCKENVQKVGLHGLFAINKDDETKNEESAGITLIYPK